MRGLRACIARVHGGRVSVLSPGRTGLRPPPSVLRIEALGPRAASFPRRRSPCCRHPLLCKGVNARRVVCVAPRCSAPP
eukprot:3208950-Prymnesium_polylepis.1